MASILDPDDTLILAFDLGTSGVKTVVSTPRGELIERDTEPYGVLLLPGGGAEQDPEDWWRAMVATTRRILDRGRIPPERIRTICVSGQYSGTVAIDESGKPMMNAIIWMDSRGADSIAELMRGLIKIEGYGLLRLLRWLRTTGGAPSKAGKDSIGHILYLRDHQPELFKRAFKFLEPKDYLNYRLCGRIASTFETMTLHWLTDNRDIKKIHYDPAILRITGIREDQLPEMLRAQDILGPLREEAASELGLTREVQVVAGTPDLHAAAIGSGAVRDFQGHVYIGTSAWLFCHVPFMKTDLRHSFGSFPSAIPGRYLVLNEQESAGACLTWLRDKVLFREDALSAGPAPDAIWAALDEVAGQAPPGSGRVIFTPWLYGERTPVEDHTLRGGFFNLSLDVDRSHLARAVLEGVAFNLRWLCEHVEHFCGRPFESLNFIGGGARSELWCQILADVLNRPIRQVADPVSANARGTALLAAVATGHLRWEQIPDCVEIQNTCHPTPANRAIYDELFREYLEIYKANRFIHARLNRAHPPPRSSP